MSKINEKMDSDFKMPLIARGITFGMYLFGTLFHLFEPKGIGEQFFMFGVLAAFDATYILNGKRLYKRYKEGAESFLLVTNVLTVTAAYIIAYSTPAGLLSPLLAIAVASLPLLLSTIWSKVFQGI
jgi:hypothetical protein